MAGRTGPCPNARATSTSGRSCAASTDPHVLIAGAIRVASLLKALWMLGTHQGLDWTRAPRRLLKTSFTFRFNPRHSRRRGLLFYRLLEQAIHDDPITYPQPDR